MSFNPSNLTLGALYQGDVILPNNVVVWRYSTTDSLSDIEAKPNRDGGNQPGIYFDSAGGYSTGMRPNDWIAVSASDGEGLYRINFVSPTLHTGSDENANIGLDSTSYAKGSSITGNFWGT